MAETREVPQAVRDFIQKLHNHILCGDLADISKCYEVDFRKLSETLYKTEAWPSVDEISNLVEDDEAFLLLYKELVFRHLCSNLTPTLAQCIESWKNYCALFDGLLESKEGVDFPNELPTQWSFDMINEFVYQFQGFCQYRAKVKYSTKNEEDVKTLKDNTEIWNVASVLTYLHRLVARCNLKGVLEHERAHAEAVAAAGPNGRVRRTLSPSPSPLHTTLGYFSLVGLSRAHTIMGHYHDALQVLDPIQVCLTAKPGQRSDGAKSTSTVDLYASVPLCRLTVSYHAGVSLLMGRRYVEAVDVFSAAVLHLARNRAQYSAGGRAVYEPAVKLNERMLALLAVAATLCPGHPVDDQVWGLTREKFSDKLGRLTRGEPAAFEELFTFASPKFVDPALPNFEAEADAEGTSAYQLQVRLFMSGAAQQKPLADLRSYLALYSTLPVSKLARFCGTDETTIRSRVSMLKYKTRQLPTPSATPSDAPDASVTDSSCYIDGDIIHFTKPKTSEWFGDHFVNHIQLCDEIVRGGKN